MNYEDAAKSIRYHKGQLTRAKKKGPQAVLSAVHAAYDEWDARGFIWPDGWSTWQVAHDDALGYPYHPSNFCTHRCSPHR